MIVASVILEDATQPDGRRWIAERHTDQLGVSYDFRYLGDADTDAHGIMSARVGQLNADLTSSEIARNLAAVRRDGAAASVTFDYSTQSQGVVAMAQLAGSGGLSPWETVLLGQFLLRLTPDQLTSLVGMTASQIATLQAAVGDVGTALAAMAQVIAAIAAAAEG
jgi:hypothetical protein